MRQFLMALTRFLGDVNAVQNNRIPQRLFNRFVGRIASEILSKIWRCIILMPLVDFYLTLV